MTTRRHGHLRLAASLTLGTLGALTLGGCGAGTPGLNQGGTPSSRTQAERDAASGNRKAEGEVGRMGLYLSVTPGPFRAPAKASTKAKTDKVADTAEEMSATPSPSASPLAVVNVANALAAREEAPAAFTGPEHLWATVLKVELIGADEKAVNVFEDADGATVDLAVLGGADGKGRRFLPLACAAPPSGRAYNRVRVTFDKAFLKFDKGAKTATTLPIADDLPRDSEGRPVVSFPLAKGRDLGSGKENLVVDIDLTRTDLSRERISPIMHEGNREGLLDAERQEAVAFTGTVSEVTSKAGETVFALALPQNRTLMVQSSDATAFFADGAEKSPALKDGVTVQVRGTLAPDTKRLVARDVRVFAGSDKPRADAATVRGKIIGYEAGGSTLTIAVRQAEGFQPTHATVIVSVPKDAILRSSGGLLLKPSEFAEQVGANKAAPLLVSVEGAYEAATGAFTATRARLEDARARPAHETEVLGIIKDANTQGRKLTVESPSEWQGFLPLAGSAGITVTASENATYQGEDGKTLSATDFWQVAAEKPSGVRVIGLYTGGKIAATRLTLAPAPVKPAAVEAKADDAKDEPTIAQDSAEKPVKKAAKPAEGQPAPVPEAPGTPAEKAEKPEVPKEAPPAPSSVVEG